MIANTMMVGNETTAEVLSSQFAKLMQLKIMKTNVGKAKDTNRVHTSQLLP